MAAGKPMLYIGDKNSEIALCIEEYNLGWIVEPKETQVLKEQIESIYNQRDNLELIKKNVRNIAVNKFAKNIILERYYALFKA